MNRYMRWDVAALIVMAGVTFVLGSFDGRGRAEERLTAIENGTATLAQCVAVSERAMAVMLSVRELLRGDDLTALDEFLAAFEADG